MNDDPEFPHAVRVDQSDLRRQLHECEDVHGVYDVALTAIAELAETRELLEHALTVATDFVTRCGMCDGPATRFIPLRLYRCDSCDAIGDEWIDRKTAPSIRFLVAKGRLT
jgi:hypothetical protein